MHGFADISSTKKATNVSQHKEVLRLHQFRRLLLARTISNFGNGMAPTAMAFSILGMPGGDAKTLSLVLTSSAIPLVLMLPIGGVFADRFGRARIIGSLDVVLSFVVLGIAYVFTLDQPPVAWLVGLSIISGILNAMWYPAYPGLPADIVDEEYLQTANSYISFGSNAATIFGAAAGGWLVHEFGGSVALAIDALTFFVAGILVWALRHTSSRSTSPESVVTELVQGWQVFWSYKWVVVVVGVFSIIVLAIRATEGVLGPLVARDHFDGAVSWSAITSAEGVGLLLGAIFATRWRPARPMVAGMLVTLPAAGFMFALAAPAPLPVIMAAGLLWGVGIEVMMILWFTALQTHIPKEAIGRVSAYDAFGSLMFGPIGLALAGPLSLTLGTEIVLIAGGILTVIMVGVSLLSREVRNLRYIEQPEAV